MLLQEHPELQPTQMCMLLLVDPLCLRQDKEQGNTRGIWHEEEKEKEVDPRLLWWGGARSRGTINNRGKEEEEYGDDARAREVQVDKEDMEEKEEKEWTERVGNPSEGNFARK